MNWHTEHHMFGAVPCYNLKGLSRTISSDMPEPRSLIGAWREMRQIWKKQQEDPAYQHDTPLPEPKAYHEKEHDPSGASLGDLSSKNLE
jgi:fatty acid desaturase